jgi:hypothetical protein
MEIMVDARGSHVLRAIVRALSGLEPKQVQGEGIPSALVYVCVHTFRTCHIRLYAHHNIL